MELDLKPCNCDAINGAPTVDLILEDDSISYAWYPVEERSGTHPVRYSLQRHEIMSDTSGIEAWGRDRDSATVGYLAGSRIEKLPLGTTDLL